MYSHQKLNEIFLVFLPDTIIDPGTVVIHPPYAVFADPAVMGPGWPVHLTPDKQILEREHGGSQGSLGTDGPVLLGSDAASLTVAVGEVYPVAGQGNNPGVGEDGPGVSHEEQEDDDVEHDNVKTAPQAPRHGL